jgi:hypothetical protein
VSSTIRLLSGQIARTVTTLAAQGRVSTLKPSTPVAHPQASPSCRSTVLLDRGDAMGQRRTLIRLRMLGGTATHMRRCRPLWHRVQCHTLAALFLASLSGRLLL